MGKYLRKSFENKCFIQANGRFWSSIEKVLNNTRQLNLSPDIGINRIHTTQHTNRIVFGKGIILMKNTV